MNDKEMAKIQVADECAETREEDLGYQMVRHYNYLSSLNHEWSNLCELAVKMYLPNKKYIDKLEQQLKEAESVIDECLSLVAQREPNVLTHKQASDAILDIMLKFVEKKTKYKTNK